MNNVLPPDDDTKTVKFLLKENLARYKLNSKGKKLKTLIIDDNQYRYNPTKPISNKLKSKLEKKRRTNEYRAYQIKELAATDTVRKFAIRKRATITEEQSDLKRMPMLTPSQIFIWKDWTAWPISLISLKD